MMKKGRKSWEEKEVIAVVVEGLDRAEAEVRGVDQAGWAALKLLGQTVFASARSAITR